MQILWIFNPYGRLVNPSLCLRSIALNIHLFKTELEFPSLFLFGGIFGFFFQIACPCTNILPFANKSKKTSLKMKRSTSPLAASLLSHCVRLPSPFFFLSVISSALKQHLLQPCILGAPLWCSAHSCVIQCQLPVSSSALLMWEANKLGCLHPPRA